MAFESEVIPLFIGGVTLVTLIELIAGCIMLKGEKENRELFLGHVVSMAIAMVFLIRCIFGGRLGIDVTKAYGDAAPFNSVIIMPLKPVTFGSIPCRMIPTFPNTSFPMNLIRRWIGLLLCPRSKRNRPDDSNALQRCLPSSLLA